VKRFVCLFTVALSFFMHAISYNLFSSGGVAKSLKLNCRRAQRVLLSSLFYGAKVSIYQQLKFATATIC
jgi:hypothetical protein